MKFSLFFDLEFEYLDFLCNVVFLVESSHYLFCFLVYVLVDEVTRWFGKEW